MAQWPTDPICRMNHSISRRLMSTRKLVHMSMLIFAFLLPFITWQEAAGLALMALLFNIFILPRLGADFRKRPTDARDSSIWTGIVIYPSSVLLLVLFYRHQMHIAAAAWAIMALGDGFATVVGQTVRGPALAWNREKSWSGLFGFVVAATIGAYALARWTAPEMDVQNVLAVSFAAAIVGAAVESLPIRLDDNISVPLVCGAFMYCAYFIERSAFWSNWPYLGRRLGMAVAVNLFFTLMALLIKWVNRSGAAVGFVLGVAIYLGYGYKSFIVLLAFVVVGSVVTRIGYKKKAAHGIAEARGGKRSWREAVANLLPAAFFSVLAFTTFPQAAFRLALLAALAEAAGDTTSSEIGKWLGGRAYLITTLRRVAPGEGGGVSVSGLVAGLIASAFLVALGYALGLCGPRPVVGAILALAAAADGNLFDSVLAATVERRGLVTNEIVNFAGTAFAGALALLLALSLRFF